MRLYPIQSSGILIGRKTEEQIRTVIIIAHRKRSEERRGGKECM